MPFLNIALKESNLFSIKNKLYNFFYKRNSILKNKICIISIKEYIKNTNYDDFLANHNALIATCKNIRAKILKIKQQDQLVHLDLDGLNHYTFYSLKCFFKELLNTKELLQLDIEFLSYSSKFLNLEASIIIDSLRSNQKDS